MGPPEATPDVADSAGVRRAAFVACSTGAFLVSLDVSIANAVLRDLGAGLGRPTPVALSWVISLYAIVFAAMLVPAGRLADRAGRHRVFLSRGWWCSPSAPVICGVAPDARRDARSGERARAVGAAAAQPASLGSAAGRPRRPGRRSIDARALGGVRRAGRSAPARPSAGR